MIAHDGTEIKVGEVYLVKASCGAVPKSGWRKATVTATEGKYATVTAPGDFGIQKIGPKDIKAWKSLAPKVEEDDPLLDTTPTARKPSTKAEKVPPGATGFDYNSGEFVSHSRKEWKERAAYCKKTGGAVEVPYGLGETWLYLPGKGKALELVAEIYDTGF